MASEPETDPRAQSKSDQGAIPADIPAAIPGAIPSAIVVPARRAVPSAVWLLTLVCGLLSVGLFFNAYRSQGELIAVEFEQGHGLQPADALRFRGIEIGRIEKIELRANPPGILVSVRLSSSARSVVTDGTAFWIARPVVSLEAVRGLETIIGPKYIAMEPGKSDQSRSTRFVGLESPPPIYSREGSVEIVLDAKKRHGLESGAPILHRGFRVGDILSVDLASDARSVILRCTIDPEYHELVRSNTKFWVRSGWSVDVGLGGIRLDADSINEILMGGVEFATPDSKGSIASTGARFALHEEPLQDWLQWQPSLPFGALWERLQRQTPHSHRTSLRWQEKSFGFTVNKQRAGWCLLLDDGTMVCRDDFSNPPESSLAGSAKLEVAGTSLSKWKPLLLLPLSDGKALTQVAVQPPPPTPVITYSSINPFEAPMPDSADKGLGDVLIVGPEASSCIVLESGRLQRSALGWTIDTSIPIPKDLDGAPVVELSGGKIVGCVSTASGSPIVATLKQIQ